MREPSRLRFAVGSRVVKAATSRLSFQVKSVCLLENGSQQLKVTWDIYWSGELMHSAASHEHNFRMSLSIWDSATKKMKGKKGGGLILSLHSTKQVYCVCCVKAGGCRRGFEWKHISPLATAAAYPCANSQQMRLGPATPSWRSIFLPTSHLPDRLLAQLSNKWSLMNNQHCFVPDQ